MTEYEVCQQNTMACEQEIAKGIIGQKDVIRQVMLALLAGGNVLLEGMPGLGKTMLVRTISQVCDLSFQRIQFTPDLMPSDVTGTNIIVKEEQKSAFRFEKGPIFANLVLADEINRATPKTQSALLEAMQEHTVTIGTTSHQLPEPFLVLATQNPIENEGTYPLPEAQLDRFLFKVLVKFPEPAGTAGNRGTDGGKPSAKDRKGHGPGKPACSARMRCTDSDCGCRHGLYSGSGYGNSCRQSVYPGGGKPACGTGTDPHSQGTRVYGKPPECLV